MNLSWLKHTELTRRNTLFACLVMFVATVFLYKPTFQFEFSGYDDTRIIGDQAHLFGNGTVVERIQNITYRDLPREEPLIVRDLSWLLDSVVFGYDRPFGYHYGNVIYHALALVMAFLLLLRLTGPPTALVAGLLLLVLAAHVEPVAWIMGRKDNLAVLCSLSSIYLYLNFMDGKDEPKRFLWYGFSLLLMGCAMLSKINAVVSPAILLLCALIHDGEILEKKSSFTSLLRYAAKRTLPVLPFFLIAAVIFLWYRSQLAQFGLFSNALDYTRAEFASVLLVLNPLILIEYLGIVFLPGDLEAYYTSPSLFPGLSSLQVAGGIGVLVLVLATMAILWRFNRTAALLAACFFVAMAPYANWVHQGFWYANRYIYFGSFFLVAAFACVIVGLLRSRVPGAVRILAVAAYAWIFAHNIYYQQELLPVWQNGEALWTHEVSLDSASINDYNNLTGTLIGKAEVSSGDEKFQWLNKARTANERALALELADHEQQWLAVTHYHRGLILAYSGDGLDAQLQHFKIAADSSAGYTAAQWSTGAAYYQMALNETDPYARQQLASDSLRYMRRHFASRGSDPKTRADEQQFYATFRADFPDVSTTDGAAEPSKSRGE